MRVPPRVPASAVAALVLLLAGCLESWRGPQRQPGSAVWVGDQNVTLKDVNRLGSVAIGEFFLEVGELTWLGAQPDIEPLRRGKVPRRTAVTLVVRGTWQGDEGLDFDEVAQGLTDRLRQVKIKMESEGLLPTGFHFDVDARGSLGAYGQVLQGVRRKLDRPLLLSATVAPEWLGDPKVASVADAVHYVVSFLYGQRLGEPDDSRLWDFNQVEQRARQLDALGRDYLVGVITLGAATHLRRQTEALATSTALPVHDLLNGTHMKLHAGFSFVGFHRQVFDLEAKRSTKVGEWRMRSGDRLRIVRPTSWHVEELQRRLEGLELKDYLGQLYYRLPAADENLGLTLDNLYNALRPGPATPRLSVAVTLLEETPSSWFIGVELRNDSPEPTAVAVIEHNYVELKATGGAFGRVELGRFHRVAFGESDTNELTMDTVRQTDTLRLHYPLLEGGMAVKSGAVEVRRKVGETELKVGAEFLLPDGRSLTVPLERWEPVSEARSDESR